MKRILFICALLLIAKFGAAQDTMYVMRSGQVLEMYSTEEIDSIIFYKPEILNSDRWITLSSPIITNTGVHPADSMCYGGAFNIYYLSFTHNDTQGVIASDLHNLIIQYEFENNGCLSTWNISRADTYFANYPITNSQNTISIPFGCSLGDTNSNWCKISLIVRDIVNNQDTSNKIYFFIRRGVNY
ncbi:hypothetical protein [Maribellus maritimus]|uniref:hypothetical protein n=1 Tax=Maribellus maritimus TaxID=2870838 RepID=UPI001EEB55DE|nr:hypothetical protein [Maribellus maritimus]MCG6187695.1 hypothetical protein [Maribellus maritimus]